MRGLWEGGLLKKRGGGGKKGFLKSGVGVVKRGGLWGRVAYVRGGLWEGWLGF